MAIDDAFESYKTKNIFLLYLDSDAFVSNQRLRLDAFNFATNVAIWEDEVRGQFCSGAMIFQGRGRDLHDFMSSWWHNNLTKFDIDRQWDQAVLNLVLKDQYHHRITMLPSYGWVKGNSLLYPYWDSGTYFFNSTIKHYVNFVKHMLGGLAERNLTFLKNEFTLLNASMLRSNMFLPCQNSRNGTFCLKMTNTSSSD